MQLGKYVGVERVKLNSYSKNMVHSQRLCCLDFVWWHIFWPRCHPLHHCSTEAEWKLIDIQSLNAVMVNPLQHYRETVLQDYVTWWEMSSIANKGLCNSAFDLLLVFPCFLIQTLTLTPPPNNANLNMYIRTWYVHYCSMMVYWKTQQYAWHKAIISITFEKKNEDMNNFIFFLAEKRSA